MVKKVNSLSVLPQLKYNKIKSISLSYILEIRALANSQLLFFCKGNIKLANVREIFTLII